MWEPPSAHALNIVTPKRVLQWSGLGLTNLFESQKESIIAATQATDDSRTLAIADGRFVFVQDTQENIVRRRHTLSDSSGHIQLLRFAASTQELYFTTSLQNMVRCYEVCSNVLHKPLCELPRPPSVLAASKQHLIVACNDPPTIVLRALTSDEKVVYVQPSSPSSNVSLAAIHPERIDLFLIGYNDGSCSIHSATQIYRRPSSSGQIAYIESLRPQADLYEGQSGIFAAEFMSGASMRVAIVSLDFSCRVVSFYEGRPIISHIWTIPCTPTSFAVLPSDDSREECLAIGSDGGDVGIFNLHGDLLRHIAVDVEPMDIIHIEWVPAKPRPATSENTAPSSMTGPSDRHSEVSQATVLVCKPAKEDDGIDGPPGSATPRSGLFSRVTSKSVRKRKPSPIVEEDEGSRSPQFPTTPKRASAALHEAESKIASVTNGIARKPLPSIPQERSQDHGIHPTALPNFVDCEPAIKASDGTTDGTSTASTSTVETTPPDRQGPKHTKLFQRFRSVKPAAASPLLKLPTVKQSPPAEDPFSTPSIESFSWGTSRQPTLPVAAQAPPPAIGHQATAPAPIDLKKPMQNQDNAALPPKPIDPSSAHAGSSTPPLTRAQEIYQKRKLTIPRRSNTLAAADRGPFLRPSSRMSSVDSTTMREVFKDFSSAGDAVKRSLNARESPRQGEAVLDEQSEVAQLRGQIDALTTQMKELGELVRMHTPEGQVSSSHPHRTTCCAADALRHLLREVIVGPYSSNESTACRSSHAVVNPSLRSQYQPSQPPPSSRRTNHRREKSSSSSSSDTSSSADKSYRSGHRRQYHSYSRPGWIRVGKFQVRRVRRDNRDIYSGKIPARRTERRVAKDWES